MLGSVQLSGKAGESVWADMETRHLEVDQPDDDRAATTVVKHWTSRLPGLIVRHGHRTADVAILLALETGDSTKAGFPQSPLLCNFMSPKIRSYVLVPDSMVGGGPCYSENSYQISGRHPIQHWVV